MDKIRFDAAASTASLLIACGTAYLLAVLFLVSKYSLLASKQCHAMRKPLRIPWMLLGLSLAMSELTSAADYAELVLRGGKIATLDDRQPNASALAAGEGKIIAVGKDAEISKLIGPETRVIELGGRLAAPGFIDGHGHFVGLGRSKMILDLTKAETWDDIVRLVKDAAEKKPPGQWIIGRGWHQSKWNKPPEPNVDGYPLHTKLSAATPKHPVLLTHASGHASIANALAMRLANVDANTPDPRGVRGRHQRLSVARQTGRHCGSVE